MFTAKCLKFSGLVAGEVVGKLQVTKENTLDRDFGNGTNYTELMKTL